MEEQCKMRETCGFLWTNGANLWISMGCIGMDLDFHTELFITKLISWAMELILRTDCHAFAMPSWMTIDLGHRRPNHVNHPPYPLVSSNIAMENPLWMEVLLRKTLINGPFSIAMFMTRGYLSSVCQPWFYRGAWGLTPAGLAMASTTTQYLSKFSGSVASTGTWHWLSTGAVMWSIPCWSLPPKNHSMFIISWY